MRNFLNLSLLVIIATMLSSCSPTFVIEAVYQESKILLGRKKIEKVIADPKTAPEEREKLQLVLDARAFAIGMGLNPKESYTKYSRVDKDVLLWVVAGSRPNNFELHTWWFPFVGRVPYKGFFSEEDALAEGERLKKKGYETFIRGSDAFSTLGWFNDPVLSTTLRNPKNYIANTVIHEILHSTIWIPDHVPFNESLANFVGFQGAIDLFEMQLNSVNESEELSTKESITTLLNEAQEARLREFEIAEVIESLHVSLSSLYAKKLPLTETVSERDRIFAEIVAPLRMRYPNLRILESANNAEIMQLKFYLTKLPEFEQLWLHSDKNWEKFLAHIEAVKEELKSKKFKDPFDALAARIKLVSESTS